MEPSECVTQMTPNPWEQCRVVDQEGEGAEEVSHQKKT